ncbi:hypothetical protein [Asanoa siamensis]|uniref:Uncharacterized protein n=1 Tax=Asanoa siamensis TaxID=926357 RepID=A0ABQ4D492_9ACTN|nr:hypothetical protein [Asanoa siamensis]GIF78364.1 hypothetical protein Asi02nite_78820 [Asanoa siamensis]
MAIYPTKAWVNYEAILKSIGEKRAVADSDSRFLSAIGLVDGDGSLTESGTKYFTAKFVQRDEDSARAALQAILIDYPAVGVICQFLSGVPNADKGNAESILRNQGMGDGLTDRSLGSLLTLMSTTGVIRYSKGTIEVLIHPAQMETVPASVFVSRATPFGNRAWLRRILRECDGFIYWLDKHFLPIALENLWEVADGRQIAEIRIISLKLQQNSGRKALRDYHDLVAELAHKSISIEWRAIDSKLIRDTHDRWIIGSSTARNVPDVGTIYSGNHSELNRSDQAVELRALFEGYWASATPIDQ